MIIRFFFILLIILFASCAKQRVESDLTKNSWVVEKVEFRDTIYDIFFVNNTMTFEKGGDCKLPYFDFSLNSKAVWSVDNVQGQQFNLDLFGSEDGFLDGIYDAELVDDASHFKMLVLTNDSLKLFCKSER